MTLEQCSETAEKMYGHEAKNAGLLTCFEHFKASMKKWECRQLAAKFVGYKSRFSTETKAEWMLKRCNLK